MPENINRYKVLICDDSITNVLVLSKLLESEGFDKVTTLTEPEKVAHELESGDYDLLMLDIEMPGMNGFDVMIQLKDHRIVDEYFPILILTGRQDTETRMRALEGGAADFINKPFDQTEVILRVKNILRVRAAYNASINHAKELERKVEKRTKELSEATNILIQRLARAGELRDNETGRHVLRVGQYARVLSEGIGLPPEISFMIEKAAPLHDLGKIGIPDSILLKKGRLDEEEREVMNTHVEVGAELLKEHESMLVKMASSIALTHHERWDGTGYPTGMSGESIPIEGRITALCDVFDALTTVRPYKDAWSIEDAVAELEKCSGSHFDPELIKVFMDNLDKIIEIRKTYDD